MLLTLNQLTPSQFELEFPIFSGTGELVLEAATRVGPSELARLGRLGIQRVFVRSPYAPWGAPGAAESGRDSDHPPDEPEYERRLAAVTLFGEVTRSLHEIVSDAVAKENFQRLEEVRSLAERVVDGVRKGSGFLVAFHSRPAHDSLFMHASATGLLSAALGLQLCVGDERLVSLVIGALLHDIGMLLTPTAVWNEPRPMTASEDEAVQRHPRLGFDLLRRVFGPLVAHVSYQHHERLDGSGYPRGLRGDDIHLFARIAAVADTFAALTSPRPYRPAVSFKDALGYIKAYEKTAFDVRVVHALHRTVPAYPAGSLVRLSDNSIAMVTESPPRRSRNPIVVTILDADGNAPPQCELIDLAQDDALSIVGPADEFLMKQGVVKG